MFGIRDHSWNDSTTVANSNFVCYFPDWKSRMNVSCMTTEEKRENDKTVETEVML